MVTSLWDLNQLFLVEGLIGDQTFVCPEYHTSSSSGSSLKWKTLWVQPWGGKRALRASQLPTRVLSCSFHSFPRRARHSLCWLLYLGMCGLSWGSIPDHSLTLSAIIYPHTEVLLITFILKSKQRAAFSGMGTCKTTLPSSDSMVPPYWSIHHTFYEPETLVLW